MSNTQKFSPFRERSTSKCLASGIEESLARSRLSADSPWRLFQVVGAKNQPFHLSNVILSLCRRSSCQIIFFAKIFYLYRQFFWSLNLHYIYYRKFFFYSARITDTNSWIWMPTFFFYSEIHSFYKSFLTFLTLLFGF